MLTKIFQKLKNIFKSKKRFKARRKVKKIVDSFNTEEPLIKKLRIDKRK